jgi:hypothetical protein
MSSKPVVTRTAIAFLLLATLVLAACGTSSPENTPAENTPTSTESSIPPSHDLPDRLQQFLLAEPGYRLLTREDAAWNDDRDGQFMPYDTADTNADGIDDVVAVVVNQGGGQYSIVCLQSQANGPNAATVWVVKDQQRRILGVDASTREISPITCTKCFANTPLRWTGSEYGAGVFFPGEKACVSKGHALMQEPSEQSSIVATLPNAMKVDVLEIGKRDPGEERWFKVRTPDERSPVEGWIRSHKSGEAGVCE